MSKSQSGDSYESGGKWYCFQVEEENVYRKACPGGMAKQQAGGWTFHRALWAVMVTWVLFQGHGDARAGFEMGVDTWCGWNVFLRIWVEEGKNK